MSGKSPGSIESGWADPHQDVPHSPSPSPGSQGSDPQSHPSSDSEAQNSVKPPSPTSSTQHPLDNGNHRGGQNTNGNQSVAGGRGGAGHASGLVFGQQSRKQKTKPFSDKSEDTKQMGIKLTLPHKLPSERASNGSKSKETSTTKDMNEQGTSSGTTSPGQLPPLPPTGEQPAKGPKKRGTFVEGKKEMLGVQTNEPDTRSSISVEETDDNEHKRVQAQLADAMKDDTEGSVNLKEDKGQDGEDKNNTKGSKEENRNVSNELSQQQSNTDNAHTDNEGKDQENRDIQDPINDQQNIADCAAQSLPKVPHSGADGDTNTGELRSSEAQEGPLANHTNDDTKNVKEGGNSEKSNREYRPTYGRSLSKPETTEGQTNKFSLSLYDKPKGNDLQKETDSKKKPGATGLPDPPLNNQSKQLNQEANIAGNPNEEISLGRGADTNVHSLTGEKVKAVNVLSAPPAPNAVGEDADEIDKQGDHNIAITQQHEKMNNKVDSNTSSSPENDGKTTKSMLAAPPAITSPPVTYSTPAGEDSVAQQLTKIQTQVTETEKIDPLENDNYKLKKDGAYWRIYSKKTRKYTVLQKFKNANDVHFEGEMLYIDDKLFLIKEEGTVTLVPLDSAEVEKPETFTEPENTVGDGERPDLSDRSSMRQQEGLRDTGHVNRTTQSAADIHEREQTVPGVAQTVDEPVSTVGQSTHETMKLIPNTKGASSEPENKDTGTGAIPKTKRTLKPAEGRYRPNDEQKVEVIREYKSKENKISMNKGDELMLLSHTREDWWLVRGENFEDIVPAKCLKIVPTIHPRERDRAMEEPSDKTETISEKSEPWNSFEKDKTTEDDSHADKYCEEYSEKPNTNDSASSKDFTIDFKVVTEEKMFHSTRKVTVEVYLKWNYFMKTPALVENRMKDFQFGQVLKVEVIDGLCVITISSDSEEEKDKAIKDVYRHILKDRQDIFTCSYPLSGTNIDFVLFGMNKLFQKDKIKLFWHHDKEAVKMHVACDDSTKTNVNKTIVCLLKSSALTLTVPTCASIIFKKFKDEYKNKLPGVTCKWYTHEGGYNFVNFSSKEGVEWFQKQIFFIEGPLNEIKSQSQIKDLTVMIDAFLEGNFESQVVFWNFLGMHKIAVCSVDADNTNDIWARLKKAIKRIDITVDELTELNEFAKQLEMKVHKLCKFVQVSVLPYEQDPKSEGTGKICVYCLRKDEEKIRTESEKLKQRLIEQTQVVRSKQHESHKDKTVKPMPIQNIDDFNFLRKSIQLQSMSDKHCVELNFNSENNTIAVKGLPKDVEVFCRKVKELESTLFHTELVCSVDKQNFAGTDLEEICEEQSVQLVTSKCETSSMEADGHSQKPVKWQFEEGHEVAVTQMEANDCQSDLLVHIMEADTAAVAPFVKKKNRKETTVCVRKRLGGTSKEKGDTETTFSCLLRLASTEDCFKIAIDVTAVSTYTKYQYLKMFLMSILSLRSKQITPITIVFCCKDENAYKWCLQIFEDGMAIDVTRMTDQCNDDEQAVVSIVKGQLSHTKADVLVNTTGTDLILDSGKVSASLLNRAGQELQIWVTKTYPQKLQFWGFVESPAFQLTGCKHIFHGALGPLETSGKCAKKKLKEFVLRCLQKANSMGLRSIAFPALGTGNLGYQPTDVAEAMYEAVREFNMGSKGKRFLREIQFVIYQKDDKVHEAFVKVEQSLEDKAQGKSLEGNTSTFLLFGNVSVHAELGNIEHTTADMIVYLWKRKGLPNVKMKGHFLLDKLGEKPKNDWNKQRCAKPIKAFTTKAYHLNKCRMVLHMPYEKGDLPELNEIFEYAITCAETSELESICFYFDIFHELAKEGEQLALGCLNVVGKIAKVLENVLCVQLSIEGMYNTPAAFKVFQLYRQNSINGKSIYKVIHFALNNGSNLKSKT